MQRNGWYAVLIFPVMLALAACDASAGPPGNGDGPSPGSVSITYWQYEHAARERALDRLMKMFMTANSDVEVKQETFPFGQYRSEIAKRMSDGTAAHLLQLSPGWLQDFAASGHVMPLPASHFEPKDIETRFVPLVQATSLDGEYYGLPIGVHTLGLFYNADMFAAAGLSVPRTWDEFIEAGRALTEREDGRLTRIGFGAAPAGQDHQLLRTVLTRQFGTEPYGENGRRVLYGNEAGLEAFEFYTGLMMGDSIAVPGFNPGANGYRDGFRIYENTAMIIDGSYAIADTESQAEFDWRVAELPVRAGNSTQANHATFSMNGITPQAFEDPAALDASVRFLQFLGTDEAQTVWFEEVGELPASTALLSSTGFSDHPVYGAFARGAAYAAFDPLIDENAQRDIMVEAIEQVVSGAADAKTAWDAAATAEQALLDAAE